MAHLSQFSGVMPSGTPRAKARHTGWGYFATDAEDLAAGPGKKDQWKDIQLTTFTNWVNDRLSGSKANYSGPVVANLHRDLSDGVILVKLLENLTNKRVRGFVKNPKITAQKMANIQLAFELMLSQEVKLIGIGSHNIYEGNYTLIMGMVWSLIQHYQMMRRGTHISTKQLMLQWIQALLPNWNITNFTSDWHDGRALLALIQEIVPDKAPAISTLDPRKSRSNCTLAVRTAKTYLKVPPIISPEDISGKVVDELSMMTYLSYFVKQASKSLLRWVKEMLPQRKITNLTTDWIDGISFAALIEAVHSGLFPHWKTLSRDKPLQNLNQVLEVAKRNLDINAEVDAKVLSREEVEEILIMTLILKIHNARKMSLPDEIKVSGAGLSSASVGKQTFFTIDTTMAGPGNLFVDACYESGSLLNFSLQEKTPGIIKLIYTPMNAGRISFDIFWSDHPVPNSPFTLEVSDSNLIQIIRSESQLSTVHVLSNVQVKLDTTLAHTGSLTACLLYENEPPINPKVSVSEGIYTIEFSPHKSGTPTLKCFWNKVPIQHCQIEYTVLDHRLYKVTNLPKKRIYHTLEEIPFTVQSQDLPLHTLRITAICGDLQIPLELSNSDVNGEVVFTPTLPGEFSIEVACIDRLVEGAPFSVTVVDPMKAVLLTKLPKHLALNASYTFKVNTKDAGPGEISFKCLEDIITDDCFSVQLETTEPHVVSVYVTPMKLGQFLLTMTHTGVEISGCPFRVTVCDPSTCKVTGDLVKMKRVSVGIDINFSVSCSNWMGLKPIIRAHGPSAKYQTTINEVKNGYAGKFTPWEIGEHEVDITLGGFHIPGSPFSFMAISVDTGVCSATGSGLQQALTMVPAQFVVVAKQPGLIRQKSIEITVQGVVNNTQGQVRARDNQNGSYNVAYLVEVPGAYLINIKAWGKHIPGSPFRLNAQPGPDAAKCRMQGPALDPKLLIKIGDPIDMSVDTREAGTGKLTVAAVGPRGVQARVFVAKGDKPGIYDIKLDPLRAGKHRVGIKWSGAHIPGSPFIMKIFPGADASKCTAAGPGLEDGKVGDSSFFTIATRDAGSGVLRVKLNGVKNAFNINLKPVSPSDVRTLHAEYNPRKPGEYLITIKWSEKHIPGSPFKVKITGDALEDPPDIRMATPHLAQELPTITEEDEDLASRSQPQLLPEKSDKEKMKNKKEKKNKSQISLQNGIDSPSSTVSLPVFKSSMPSFDKAFVTNSPKKGAKTVGYSGALKAKAQKMLTFSNLNSVKKAYGSKNPDRNQRYSGQAHIQVNSVRGKKF